MTRFTRDSLRVHGGYMHFESGSFADGTFERKFVARFKYSASGTFKTFLIKNFTVEEYFAKLDAGFAPLTILEAKGFVSHNVRKAMKARGYTTFTTETWREYFTDHMRRTTGDENYDMSEFYAKQDEEYAAINKVAA